MTKKELTYHGLCDVAMYALLGGCPPHVLVEIAQTSEFGNDLLINVHARVASKRRSKKQQERLKVITSAHNLWKRLHASHCGHGKPYSEDRDRGDGIKYSTCCTLHPDGSVTDYTKRA